MSYIFENARVWRVSRTYVSALVAVYVFQGTWSDVRCDIADMNGVRMVSSNVNVTTQ